MATLAQIREALRARLDAAIDDVQVSAYNLVSPTPPCLLVGGPDDEDGVVYQGNGAAMSGGTIRWRIPVMAYVGTPTDIGAQKQLDLLIDPTGDKSVAQAVKADRTLGGVVQDAVVLSCTGYRMIQPPGISTVYLGAVFTVSIQAPGVT